MPLKRQPKTLFKHCIEMSIYKILIEWKEHNNTENNLLFSDILPILPPSVLDNLVTEVIDVFVQTVNSHGNGGLKTTIDDGSLSGLLKCILSKRLTFLDLNPLARLESVPYVEVVKSERVILKSLSYMNNLVSLSFKANRNTHTVPVAGDELLKEICYNCPKLKFLDVSYNHTVTNEGLPFLWECPDKSDKVRRGCPDLQKLIIFGCAVTPDGVAKVLKHLSSLKLIGYKETGTSLLNLSKANCNQILNLTYMNNMGCGIKTVEDLHRLHFSCKMSHIIFDMCPYISEIKARVTDATLEHVILGEYVNSMHLMFEIGRRLPVGKGLVNFIKNYGCQLTTLSMVCSTIKTSHLLIIGELCMNLNTLNIKCDQVIDHENILHNDFQKFSPDRYFINLENLFLTILSSNDNVGMRFLPYIVHTNELKNFYFSLNSTQFTNGWVEEFFTIFDTKYLESFVIDVPSNVFAHAALTLTMASVELILAKCPQIRTVGNLFAWCISVEEMKELCRVRELENSDLEFIYHPVPVHMNFQIFNN